MQIDKHELQRVVRSLLAIFLCLGALLAVSSCQMPWGGANQSNNVVTPPITSPKPLASTVTNSSVVIGEPNILSIDDNQNSNLLLAQQTTLGQSATIQTLSFYVTTAAGKLRLGIYDASGPGGGPGRRRLRRMRSPPSSAGIRQASSLRSRYPPGPTGWPTCPAVTLCTSAGPRGECQILFICLRAHATDFLHYHQQRGGSLVVLRNPFACGREQPSDCGDRGVREPQPGQRDNHHRERPGRR